MNGGAGLALLAALMQTVGTAVAARGEPHQPGVLGYVLLAVAGLAVGARHSNPRGAAFLIAATTVAYHALDFPSGPQVFVAGIICAVTLMKADRHGVVFGFALLSYGVWLLVMRPSGIQALILAAWLIGLFVLCGMAGELGKMFGRMGQEQRRLRVERQRRQASEERLRIARELHDVVGHHLSLINVRAGVGRHLMDREPEQARAALDTIKQASAEALQEVQAVLNALRPADEAAPLAPAPGLDRLGELTADAGIPVEVTIVGEARPLPADIDRAAYRIVQEALTNVRRHADPSANVAITIEFQTDSLLVRIEDDGQRADSQAAEEGNGITGMRERAAALGGTLSAGPHESGWRVSAALPLSGLDSAR
ncbi:sensor histidine kinase [Allorhizocola rhizosphaerae]|uniref:sensor histidine kinase n=1 Tax=Allorhizocola rhizosphaerae TaxID=1872709 RepID=UPI001FE65293|nr:sensor histidine kinase [Allorhizocola rhizosphaerae]